MVDGKGYVVDGKGMASLPPGHGMPPCAGANVAPALPLASSLADRGRPPMPPGGLPPSCPPLRIRAARGGLRGSAFNLLDLHHPSTGERRSGCRIWRPLRRARQGDGALPGEGMGPSSWHTMCGCSKSQGDGMVQVSVKTKNEGGIEGPLSASPKTNAKRRKVGLAERQIANPQPYFPQSPSPAP
eukprot:1851673-Pyramimonas_sp.AAC.1